RAALDWLNEITPDEIGFFGLEVELWRIADSPFAPKFNIVSRPNEWIPTPNSRSQEGVTEAGALHLEFWTQLRQYMEQKGSPVKIRPSTANLTQLSLGRSGFGLKAANLINAHASWVWLLLHGPYAKAHYHLIKDLHGQEVEAALGDGVLWQEQADKPFSAISIQVRSDLRDRSTWPELNACIASNLEAMDRLFRPMVRTLDSIAYVPLESEMLGSESLDQPEDEL